MYKAVVVADSIGPSGCRLISVLCSYPLMVHAEHLRHRVFSFSVASNRAIPTRLILRQVIDDPVVPVWFGKNQGGMSAREELTGWRYKVARWTWLAARWPMVAIVWFMLRVGLHKQIANRILSPWQWVTVLVTGTEWENFFALRCHPDAQPEMRKAAEMIRDVISESKPRVRKTGEWHLPFVTPDNFWSVFGGCDPWAKTVAEGDEMLAHVSTARCARVSYARAEEQFHVRDEIAKSKGHIEKGHWSPAEHPAQALATSERVANFRGWSSFRSTIPNEDNFARLANQ